MFNIFKRNEKSPENSFPKPRTVLCIPGNWNSRTDIVTAIAENNIHEYIFAGAILLDLRTKKGSEVEIFGRDERLKEAFKYAGMTNNFTEEFLNEIGNHKHVIYLSAETGDPESAKAIAEAGRAILKAGGLGIKVESAGKAFTREQWESLLDHFDAFSLYTMFVFDCIGDEKGKVFSCGMHNLGFKDCVVYHEDFQTSVNLIAIFNQYQLIENPQIKVNQTFSTEREAPVFVITEEQEQPYLGEGLFENPFGMWRLERKVRG